MTTTKTNRKIVYKKKNQYIRAPSQCGAFAQLTIDYSMATAQILTNSKQFCPHDHFLRFYLKG